MNLLLQSLKWMEGDLEVIGDIRVSHGKIVACGKLEPAANETCIPFENQYVYPGLINAHDHLEMNLYPRLGNPPYRNYVEWGNDIYRVHESPVREIERVDIRDRLLWGGIKNLLSGVTTVIHHN